MEADNEALMGEMMDDAKSQKSKKSQMSKKSNMSSKSSPVVQAMEAVEKEKAEMCCCCICQCSEPRTIELGCCCFFPIRCGVIAIGVFILVICLVQFLEVFYQLLNDDIHWWYVAVGVAICVPLIIAAMFVVVFFTKDTPDSRGKLKGACILTIISVTLLAVWNTCYFLFWYKESSVKTGNDGIGFVKATRKQEIVFSLYIAAVIDALFAYYICVVANYCNALKEPEEEVPKMMTEPAADMMDMMMDDKKDDMMMEEEKKDDEPNMEAMDDMMMGDGM